MRDPAPSPDATMKRISRFLAMAQLFSLACPMIALAQQPSSLEGSTRTSLLTGGPVSARWTSAGGDDAFLMVDATTLRAAGVSLLNASSEPLEGNQLLRDGLRVKDADGTVNAGELSAMADTRVGGLDARIGDASFSTADGATRTMSSVATTP
jgi:hypothetical protein